MRVTPTLALAFTLAVPATLSAQASPTAAPATRPKPAQLPADSMQIARKYVMWLYTSRSDSIIAHMDSAGRAQPGVAQQVDGAIAQLALNAGTEVKLIEEKFITRMGNRQYWRTATFTGISQPVVVRIVINARGEWTGLGLNPLSQAPPIDP